MTKRKAKPKKPRRQSIYGLPVAVWEFHHDKMPNGSPTGAFIHGFVLPLEKAKQLVAWLASYIAWAEAREKDRD